MLLYSNTALSDLLVLGAKIVAVENTQNVNGDSFVLTLSGGTGTCANSLVFFPVSAAGNFKEMHKRAYSSSLTALTTDINVDIHSFSDSTCNNASWIKLRK